MRVTLQAGNSLDDFDRSKTYYVMRPLVKNMPDGGPGDVIVNCDLCGQECWKRPEIEPDPFPPRFKPACSECALKSGAKFAREETSRNSP